MRTVMKTLIFVVKFIGLKMRHWKGISILSVKALLSRCRFLSTFLVLGQSRITIGRIECATNTHISAVSGGCIVIEDGCFFNRNITIVSRNSIEIGSRCTFGPNVCIYDHDHEYGEFGQTGHFKLGSIRIGSNCWVGANTVILRDTVIGNNCVIGAGCIVKGIIPDNSLVTFSRNLTIKPLHN